MKIIKTRTVGMFFNGALHSLDLVEAHWKDDNQHAVEIELIKAISELEFLLRELEKAEP